MSGLLLNNSLLISTFIQEGKYTYEEINDLINIDGYIPVSTVDEFDNLRTSISQKMGTGTPWVGNYTTGLDKKYVQIYNLDFDTFGVFVNYSELTTSFIYDGNLLNIYNIELGDIGSGVGLFATNRGDIINLFIDNITANCIIGSAINSLFVGINYGTIEDCSVNGDLSVDIGAGASKAVFIGSNESTGVIRKCKASGSVDGFNDVGGFAGYSYGTFENCCSDVEVTANGSFVGGFISRCLTTCSIDNCYSDGVIIPNSSTGVGGFAGGNTGTITNSYWDTVTSGQATSAGGTGKTTTEMQQGSIPDTAIYVGWSAAIWDAVDNSSYPELISLQ